MSGLTRTAQAKPAREQLTLGEFISRLEGVQNKEVPVYMDFEYLAPTRFASWRGSYDELALGFCLDGYNESDKPIKSVAELLAHTRECVGEVFEGWKGGAFKMDATTPLWVANTGNSGHEMITGIEYNEYQCVILSGIGEF